jgi:hypothetical protein
MLRTRIVYSLAVFTVAVLCQAAEKPKENYNTPEYKVTHCDYIIWGRVIEIAPYGTPGKYLSKVTLQVLGQFKGEHLGDTIEIEVFYGDYHGVTRISDWDYDYQLGEEEILHLDKPNIQYLMTSHYGTYGVYSVKKGQIKFYGKAITVDQYKDYVTEFLKTKNK